MAFAPPPPRSGSLFNWWLVVWQIFFVCVTVHGIGVEGIDLYLGKQRYGDKKIV